MPQHFSSILNYFFSNERSRGLHCYSIRGNWVLLLSVVFFAAKSTVARFSQSIQRKAADGAKALEGQPHSQVIYINPQSELPSESQKGGIRPKIYITEFHCPYSRLKGHSCKRCLSHYVLDLDLNMPKHFSSILNYFFSNERSRGLHCYSIRGHWVLLLSVVFFAAKSTVARFSKYPTQSIQRKAADGAKALEGQPHTQVTYNNPQTELQLVYLNPSNVSIRQNLSG